MFQNEERISGHQALMLIIAAGLGNIFVVIQGPAVQYSGRDGWISVLLAYILAIIDGLFLINLNLRFPEKTFVQYLPIVLGKFLGKVASLYYILGFWIMAPLIMREIIELMRFFLPYTPAMAVNILMSILIIYVMRSGFEVYARTAELFSLLIIIFIVLLMLMISPNVDFSNILPLLENGPMPILKSQLILFPYAVETVLFMALWFPCLRDKKEGKKALIIGSSISGVLLSLLVIIGLGFAGMDIIVKLVFPVFYMSRYILIANFLSGLEAVFMLLWMLSSYLELLVFYYPPVIGLAQWLNLKNYKTLILPVVIINIILATLPDNIVQIIKLDIMKNPIIILPLAILIPITWLVASIRKL
ncbi:GerAB/ArcD/ProY family transporter [Desnuesiella massiliensis]|uniref:GerAB/ArcD/ProY family transporter n=1 Tax=Desnuesiella massiliensis TaxID=1650662 RepID=UPI0006E2E492|nr:endospore germination permease [Desnuesiella massiliensis]